MSNFYPTQLRSFVNKLHGFGQSTVKLSPLSGTLNAGPRQTIVVSLPPNTLILPESFTMWARATTSGALQAPPPSLPGSAAVGTQIAVTPVVQLPNNAESLITSVAITANGQSIDAGPGGLYNQLFNLLADVQLGGKKNERAIAQLGADLPAQTWGNPAVNPSPTVTPSSTQFNNNLEVPTIYTTNTATTNPGTFDMNNAQVIAISNWLGFLSSTEVIDTDLLGDVRVSITLADTNVLVIDNYSTDYKTINYALNNIFFTVNTISLSPEWYQAQAVFLEKGGVLQRKCSLWWAFQGSVVQGIKQPLAPVAVPTAATGMYTEPTVPGGIPTQTVNFSLASQSVDLLIGTMITVPDNTHPWLARYEMTPAGRDFSFRSVGRGAAFKRPGYHLSSYQFSVNNVTIPNFRVDMNDAWQHSQIAMGLSNELIQGTNPVITHMDKWTQAYWFCACSLAALAPADVRLISGYESRGSNANFSWDITGANGNNFYSCRPTVFAKTSSTLRIARNRMLEMVY